jgi:hypothetical protein
MKTTLTIDWYTVLTVCSYLCVFAAIVHSWRESKRSAHEKALRAANEE